MSKKKVVAPFLKPIAILSISLGIGATTAVVDQSYRPKAKSDTQTTSTMESIEIKDTSETPQLTSSNEKPEVSSSESKAVGDNKRNVKEDSSMAEETSTSLTEVISEELTTETTVESTIEDEKTENTNDKIAPKQKSEVKKDKPEKITDIKED